MNQRDFEDLISIVSSRLMRLREDQNGVLHEGQIEEVLDRELNHHNYDVDRNTALSRLERNFEILIGPAATLRGTENHPEPWVAERRNEGRLEWAYWARYRLYLLRNWAGPTVSRLDQNTDQILNNIMPPDTPGLWDQRGLVVGHIQSGKTSNFTGLICKAIDAGYKVVIVLAGMHKNLRTQTQIRLEEGFLGYATTDENIETRHRTGVGDIESVDTITDSITTRGDSGDFKKANARHAGYPGYAPQLFVIKKNTSVLKNLFNWVSGVAQTRGDGNHILNIPLLMIDDESDYASVDTGIQEFENQEPDPEYDPKRINGWIRKIIKKFGQSVYIGYTATPQANIFIHHKGETEEHGEDLFPRSFITVIEPPDNYIGPKKMFALDSEVDPGINCFINLRDHAESLELDEREGWMPPKHDRFHTPLYQGRQEVPPSLKEAIKVFILSTAVRILRGQENEHSTMLIHVSLNVDVQNKVKQQVEDAFNLVHSRVIYGDGDGESVMEQFSDVWQEIFVAREDDFEGYDLPEWENVKEKIPEVVNLIQTKEINGSAGDILDYVRYSELKKPLYTIVIGGNKLSRGLTLEGLTVSYFLRPSRMYDTLMQMGRWFGYREGFLDVCRIYTTANLQRWFRHATSAIEVLREDFDRMVASGFTPRQFGHRVLNHPLMMVTSPTKMRNASRMQASYEGTQVDIVRFRVDRDSVENNFEALKKLGDALQRSSSNSEESTEEFRGPFCWENVSPEHIIDFLKTYKGHPGITRTRPEYIASYIENQARRNMLTEWTVKICQGDKNRIPFLDSTVKQVRRKWEDGSEPSPGEKVSYGIKRSGSPNDEYWDMPAGTEEYDRALRKTHEIWVVKNPDKDLPATPKGAGIRYTRPPERGLICLYPIEADRKDEVIPPLPCPMVGYYIGFPGDENAEPIEYVVNDIYRRQEDEGFWDE